MLQLLTEDINIFQNSNRLHHLKDFCDSVDLNGNNFVATLQNDGYISISQFSIDMFKKRNGFSTMIGEFTPITTNGLLSATMPRKAVLYEDKPKESTKSRRKSISADNAYIIDDTERPSAGSFRDAITCLKEDREYDKSIEKEDDDNKKIGIRSKTFSFTIPTTSRAIHNSPYPISDEVYPSYQTDALQPAPEPVEREPVSYKDMLKNSIEKNLSRSYEEFVKKRKKEREEAEAAANIFTENLKSPETTKSAYSNNSSFRFTTIDLSSSSI